MSNRSKRYVKKRLEKLTELFPNIKVQYEIRPFTNAHCIQVLPKRLHNSIKFQHVEADITFEFIDKYPHEELFFVTEGSLVEVENPIYETTGIQYRPYDLYSLANPLHEKAVCLENPELEIINLSVSQLSGSYGEYSASDNDKTTADKMFFEIKEVDSTQNTFLLAT